MTSNMPPVPTMEQRDFKRTLGKSGIFFLGFGSMIGFGWVVLTGGWIEDAGAGGVAVAFLIGGAIMALVGLVYGELASAIPLAGGEHNYLLRGMGPRLAMLGSWGIVGGYVTVMMFQTIAAPRAATYLFPGLAQIPMYEFVGEQVYLTWVLFAVGISAILTVLNIRGMRNSSLFQTSIMMFLVLVAVTMLISTFFAGDVANVEPIFTGGSAGIIAVLVVVPFLMVGFDIIPQAAEESNIPRRQLGKLIILSVVTATVFYIVIATTTSFAAPARELFGFDLATGDALAYMLGHDFWGNLVIAGGLAGVVTTWNAFMVGASRLLWAMSNSGMIPKWFSKMNKKNGTPVNALIFLGILTAIAPFVGEVMLDWAVDAGSPSIVITYLLVAVTFLILRRREPDMERPMRVGKGDKLGVVVGVGAVLSTAGLLVLYLPGMPAFLDLGPWLLFTAWWVAGIIFALRIPYGIKAGPDTEALLLAALAQRRTLK